MADVWRTRDRFGREVVLTDRGWAHILERRPTMAGREDAIRLTVEAPDSVKRDAKHPDREIFYRRFDGRRNLKVVVGFDGSGTVITAYPIGHPKQGEQQLWP